MSRRLLGLDVGGTGIKAALLDGEGRVLRRARWATAELGIARESILPALESRLLGMLAREAITVGDLGGLGLACPGLVDADTGRLHDAPNLRHWEGLDIGPWLADRFRCPVALDNDVNALAYGEWRLGAGRGTRDMVCLALGTGVGGGLILDGKIYRGWRGLGAELGHLSIDRHGRRCACGNRGCLEAYAGAWALSATARRALARRAPGHRALARLLAGQPPTPAALSRAAAGGSALARELWAEAGCALGVALAGLVNIFAPERIVIAGGLSRAGRLLMEPACQEARRRLMNPDVQRLDLRRRALGDDGAAIGAALQAGEERP
jgi:glucokinase